VYIKGRNVRSLRFGRVAIEGSHWPGRLLNMDVTKILSELREERRQIEEAIVSLERLAQGRGKRRGRPPAWMSQASAPAEPIAKRRGRPPGSKNKVAPAEPKVFVA
jgi:hypothetical protein